MKPGLYLATDPELTRSRGLATVVAQAVAGGVSTVQIRDKHADDDALVHTVAEVRRAGVTVPILVNDSVAAAAHADGVHLGQSDADPVRARRELGPAAVIGLSVSDAEQLHGAAALPPGTLDYLGVGPVWATATKPDTATPLGPDGVAELAAATALPMFAIGGITPGERVRALRGLGLAGICVVSAVCAAPDPRAAAHDLLGEWEGSPG